MDVLMGRRCPGSIPDEIAASGNSSREHARHEPAHERHFVPGAFPSRALKKEDREPAKQPFHGLKFLLNVSFEKPLSDKSSYLVKYFCHT